MMTLFSSKMQVFKFINKMSSTASTQDSSSSESDNDCFPDINKLKPYDLEPEI